MTTPNQPAPAGAFIVGGGEYNFGQGYTEEIVKDIFAIPAPTLTNMLELFRTYLLKLPLDTLKLFQPIIDGTDSQFIDKVTSVETIVSALIDLPAWLDFDVWTEWVENIFTPFKLLFDTLKDAWDNFLDLDWHPFKAIWGDLDPFSLDGGFTDWLSDIWAPFFDIWENFFSAWNDIDWDNIGNGALLEWVASTWEPFFSSWEGIDWEDLGNGALLEWIASTWEPFATIFDTVKDAVDTLTDWLETVFTPFKTVVDCVIAMLNDLKDILEGNEFVQGFLDFADDTGDFLKDAVNGMLSWVQQFFGIFADGIVTPGEIFGFFQDIVDNIWGLITGTVGAVGKKIWDIVTDLPGFFDTIPFFHLLRQWIEENIIQPFIGMFTGNSLKTKLSDLAEFVSTLLTRNTPIPAENIIGKIRDSVLGIIPVANIADVAPNLLSHGGFLASSTVDPLAAAAGWTWDSTQNQDTANPGGAVKVTTNAGAVRTLYSTQSIPVNKGDKLLMKARVKTSGYTGSSSSLQIGLVPFVGQTQQSEVIVNTRGGVASWSSMTGTVYQVPTGVTSVTVFLRCVGTAGVAYFDTVELTKTGLMQQGLVDRLTEAWDNMWNGFYGSIGITGVGVDGLYTATSYTRSNVSTATANASSAVSTANTASTTANSANTTASTANTNATTANTNMSATWNKLYEARYGGTFVNRTVEDAKTAVSAIYSTANTANSTASSATSAAAVADGKAVIADGKAVTAGANVQATWNRLWEARYGGTATGKTDADAKTAMNSVYSTATTATTTANAASSSASTANSLATTAGNNVQSTWNKLYEARYGGTASGRSVDDAKTAMNSIYGVANTASTTATTASATATTASSTASAASSAATTANSNITSVVNNSYNSWYGSGGTGNPSQMTSIINSIKSAVGGGWTVEVWTSGGTWYRSNVASSNADFLEFWAICIGGGQGGGCGLQQFSSGASGGYGGDGGKYFARQIDPTTLTSTVSVAVGAGSAGRSYSTTVTSPNSAVGESSFGAYAASNNAVTASIGSVVGYYAATDSRPGAGGNGSGGGSGTNGLPGGSTPLASGGVGGGHAAVGQNGYTASLTGQTRAGGGGGGGGGGGTFTSGGNGGNGGFPGGGGGGGGGASGSGGPHGGNGGNGANGAVILLYKLKS